MPEEFQKQEITSGSGEWGKGLLLDLEIMSVTL